jgi:maltokinase
MTFEETLAEWIPTQRWFAGKGTRILSLAIVADTELASGEPGLRHLIVTVSQGGGRADSYQLFLGERAEVPDHLRHVLIGPAPDGRLAYDALHDAELTRLLLRGIADGSQAGPLRFRTEPGAALDTDLDSLVLIGEQSNTSLIFGEESILKVFRRPAPGINPDLEVNRALHRLGSRHIAEPLGWIETTLGGAPMILGILSAYQRAATDGWTLAATSVRDLYASETEVAADAGGDFAGEAYRLGEATAEVHRDLARAFGIEELPAEAISGLADDMFHRLDEAIAAVPELGQHADLVGAAYSDLAKLDVSLDVQRVHGDYHLGQVLRTQTGWVVLDFEGEPVTPLSQRRAPASALRDVAGMLRSFDYAARHQLLMHRDEDRLHPAAVDWVRRNQDAFCVGYAAAGGTDPGTHAIVLRAFLLDKAVYEVMYEARHRPGWLAIPLGSIADA